jgi:hypothetical protein
VYTLAVGAMHDGDALLPSPHVRGQLLHHAVQLIVVLISHGSGTATTIEPHTMVQNVAQRVAKPREVDAGAPGANAGAYTRPLAVSTLCLHRYTACVNARSTLTLTHR